MSSKRSNIDKPSKGVHPYDYGYNINGQDAANTSRVSLNIQQGENLYNLGGKPDIQE